MAGTSFCVAAEESDALQLVPMVQFTIRDQPCDRHVVLRGLGTSPYARARRNASCHNCESGWGNEPHSE